MSQYVCCFNGVLQLFIVVDKRCIGDSIDAVNNYNLTPMMIAVRSKKMICALGLSLAGANPDDTLDLAIKV